MRNLLITFLSSDGLEKWSSDPPFVDSENDRRTWHPWLFWLLKFIQTYSRAAYGNCISPPPCPSVCQSRSCAHTRYCCVVVTKKRSSHLASQLLYSISLTSAGSSLLLFYVDWIHALVSLYFVLLSWGSVYLLYDWQRPNSFSALDTASHIHNIAGARVDFPLDLFLFLLSITRNP